MSDAPASILPRKIESRPPGRSKSAFSPEMLRLFCGDAGEALSAMLGARTVVSLASVGLEPMADLVPAAGSMICGAVVELNDIRRAATVSPDCATLFHVVDLMLGGDPLADMPVLERAPSSLDDSFCKSTVDVLMNALSRACDATIGPGRCLYTGRVDVIHEGEALAIVEPKADVLSIDLELKFGQGGREGTVTLHVPLTTIDAISGTVSTKSNQPAFENGPWFTHMKSTVSEMEIETYALLHTESMSLAALSRLDVGSVIALDTDAITSVVIALEDGGDIIASGELGTSSGKRVISLDAAPDEAFMKPVAELFEQDRKRRS